MATSLNRLTIITLTLTACLTTPALPQNLPLKSLQPSKKPSNTEANNPVQPTSPRSPQMTPLATKSYPTTTLTTDFPPTLKDPNKKLAFSLAAANPAPAGTITYSRYTAQPLPATVPPTPPTLDLRPDFFTYDPPAPNTTEWHLNFAHFDLFAYYGSSLLAQDELQVAEHPLLASLREALRHDKRSTLTVDGNTPTPILIQGAPRQIKIALDPNASELRPSGLYGNNFARAPQDAVRKAITPIQPPTLSNIIAIEAPPGGTGTYTATQIRFILTTATTAFQAAKAESATPQNPDPTITIHTGFWGCGAYGGNRTLMATLQLLAAQLAHTNTLTFHAGDKYSLPEVKSAQSLLTTLLTQTTTTGELITHLEVRHFPWGHSDGN